MVAHFSGARRLSLHTGLRKQRAFESGFVRHRRHISHACEALVFVGEPIWCTQHLNSKRVCWGGLRMRVFFHKIERLQPRSRVMREVEINLHVKLVSVHAAWWWAHFVCDATTVSGKKWLQSVNWSAEKKIGFWCVPQARGSCNSNDFALNFALHDPPFARHSSFPSCIA